MAQVGRGPLNALLSNTGAQWASVAGVAAYVWNPEAVQRAVRSLTSDYSHNNNSTFQNGSGDTNNSALDRPQSHSIVIHTGTAGSSDRDGGGSGGYSRGNGGVITTIVTYTIGIGCAWITYTVLSNALPEYVGTFLPVTRRAFDKTTKNLANSLLFVKEAMVQQIQHVMKMQGELGAKQDETHRAVQDILDDVQFVRTDLSTVIASVDRCEAAVDASQRLQAYTARGVKLLVAAVATVLPRHGDEQSLDVLRELEHYARDGGDAPRRPLTTTTTVQQQPSQSHRATEEAPPENEHPRLAAAAVSSPPPQSLSSSSLLPLPPQRLEDCSTTEILAMLRDGRLGPPQGCN